MPPLETVRTMILEAITVLEENHYPHHEASHLAVQALTLKVMLEVLEAIEALPGPP